MESTQLGDGGIEATRGARGGSAASILIRRRAHHGGARRSHCQGDVLTQGWPAAQPLRPTGRGSVLGALWRPGWSICSRYGARMSWRLGIPVGSGRHLWSGCGVGLGRSPTARFHPPSADIPGSRGISLRGSLPRSVESNGPGCREGSVGGQEASTERAHR